MRVQDAIVAVRARLRDIDSMLDQLRSERAELSATIKRLKVDRQLVQQEMAHLRVTLKTEADRSREVFELNVMARVDQRMTTQQIAEALKCSRIKVDQAIAAHRRAQGVPKKARRRQPFPERRALR